MFLGRVKSKIREIINTIATQLLDNSSATKVGKILNKAASEGNPKPIANEKAAIKVFL
jgi:hypothetical protein